MSVVGRFSFSDIIVLVLGECTGVPLCIAGGEAFAHSEWIPAIIGWGIGIPLVVAGASFHFWKDSVKMRVVTVIRPYTWVFVPIAVLLAFIYVVGPNIYNRTMMARNPPQVSKVSATDIEKTAAPAALISNTNLRLLMRENNDPEQLSQTNIWRWNSLRNRGIDAKLERSHIVTYFFLTFDNPAATNYRRVFSSTHQNLEFQIVDITARSMIVAVRTDPTGAIIDFQISENPL